MTAAPFDQPITTFRQSGAAQQPPARGFSAPSPAPAAQSDG